MDAPGEAEPGGERGADLRVPDLSDRAADLLDWIWARTVEPDWPRRRRSPRPTPCPGRSNSASSGLAAALDGMRPGMRWLGDGRLQVTPGGDLLVGIQRRESGAAGSTLDNF